MLLEKENMLASNAARPEELGAVSLWAAFCISLQIKHTKWPFPTVPCPRVCACVCPVLGHVRPGQEDGAMSHHIHHVRHTAIQGSHNSNRLSC